MTLSDLSKWYATGTANIHTLNTDLVRRGLNTTARRIHTHSMQYQYHHFKYSTNLEKHGVLADHIRNALQNNRCTLQSDGQHIGTRFTTTLVCTSNKHCTQRVCSFDAHKTSTPMFLMCGMFFVARRCVRPSTHAHATLQAASQVDCPTVPLPWSRPA